MTKKVTVNGNTYHVKCNNVPRELVAWNELEHSVIADTFGEDYSIDNDEIQRKGK